MKSKIMVLSAIALIVPAVASATNTGTITQSGSGHSADAIFTNTDLNTVEIDQSGIVQEALVEIIRGSENAVSVTQNPLAFHDVNLLIRRGNLNEVTIDQSGVDNDAGIPGASRLRIIRGDENVFTINQNSGALGNELDLDVIDGDRNTVDVNQQLASAFNDVDIRIENSSDNVVDVNQVFFAGVNDIDVDIYDGGDNTVELAQLLAADSSIKVEIAGSNKTATIVQGACLSCTATSTQIAP